MKFRQNADYKCICSVLLYDSETQAVKADGIRQLVRNDNTMVRWICSAKFFEKIPMSDLRTCMGISSIEDVIRYNRLLVWSSQHMDEKNGPERT